MRKYDINDIVLILNGVHLSGVKAYIAEIIQKRENNWDPLYKVIFIDKRYSLPKYGWYTEEYIKMDLENSRNKKLNNLGL
jgi:hypothetical protein